VLHKVPGNAQVILMSATMPEPTLKLTSRFMRNPLKFLLRNDELTLDGIRQYYLNVEKEEEKLNTLSDIYESISKAQGMIFCRTRARVNKISKQMQERSHIVSAMVSGEG
jgi:translation initiation factor 4A